MNDRVPPKQIIQIVLFYTLALSVIGAFVFVGLNSMNVAEQQEKERLAQYLELSKQGRILPPCAEEDSDNCYWSASERSNGLGLSFVTINGNTYYLAP